jgi:hypothetical protein
MDGNRSDHTIEAGFYWIGVASSLACFFLVFARNTEFGWRFEHSNIPLSWLAGAVAILAFLAAEFLDRDEVAIAEPNLSQEALQQELPGRDSTQPSRYQLHV